MLLHTFAHRLRKLYGWRYRDNLIITFKAESLQVAWPDLHGATMEREIPYTEMSAETLQEFSALFQMTAR